MITLFWKNYIMNTFWIRQGFLEPENEISVYYSNNHFRAIFCMRAKYRGDPHAGYQRYPDASSSDGHNGNYGAGST